MTTRAVPLMVTTGSSLLFEDLVVEVAYVTHGGVQSCVYRLLYTDVLKATDVFLTLINSHMPA